MKGEKEKRKHRICQPVYNLGPHHRQHIKYLDKIWYVSSSVSYSDLMKELNFILITPIQIVVCQDTNPISKISQKKKKAYA
jgi:hypothetical protein